MGNVKNRLDKLDGAINPHQVQTLELCNDRGEVYYRMEKYQGEWITTINNPTLRTDTEVVYTNGQEVKTYIGISLLDL